MAILRVLITASYLRLAISGEQLPHAADQTTTPPHTSPSCPHMHSYPLPVQASLALRQCLAGRASERAHALRQMRTAMHADELVFDSQLAPAPFLPPPPSVYTSSKRRGAELHNACAGHKRAWTDVA
ncbi:hypothetical protein T492DRAFT_418306 [Pavlovales sp. CCMP2436]|nr:hypothetical protein T492DRAFT_418306 [Pavlovales sp. CCMP2436]